MSLSAYITPIDWVPDDTAINATLGSDFIGWKLGINPQTEKALWTFGALTDTPTDPIEDLLPVGYTEIVLLEDVTKYGFTRVILPNFSIGDLETEFLTAIEEAIAAIPA